MNCQWSIFIVASFTTSFRHSVIDLHPQNGSSSYHPVSLHFHTSSDFFRNRHHLHGQSPLHYSTS
ncbi:hypothetical protein [Chryseobacterium taeanense]|uniref:hypothetical protein n=1 Tax=Chryseobacterium taeanense TaxID=311334 RepID=UPI0011142439|nr:hypothetical protein [Chryseobacterium taeanense]